MDSPKAAVDLANDSPFGLSSSIYSADVEAAVQLADQLGFLYLPWRGSGAVGRSSPIGSRRSDQGPTGFVVRHLGRQLFARPLASPWTILVAGMPLLPPWVLSSTCISSTAT
ncbi:hypothetical protein [Arthrobacter sp. V4I6]|uniref:hypothetical protein n=1 Tax=unclassified Arthrobacter TaxID=235627 RepID=UPI0035934F1D